MVHDGNFEPFEVPQFQVVLDEQCDELGDALFSAARHELHV